MKRRFVIKNLTDNSYYTFDDEFDVSVLCAMLFDSAEEAEEYLERISVDDCDFLTIIKIYKNL